MAMAVNMQLKKLETPIVDIHQYQSMLGSLMYASIVTHPNISFAFNILAQHASAPSEPHLQVLKHVFHYLARMREYCLIFNG